MPAITMVLHTWTRELVFHPHVHAIVSAGGVTRDGSWLASRGDYLFPVKVLGKLFRGLFRQVLLEAIDSGKVQVAADLIEPMRRALFEKKWVVYAKAPFGGAEQVFAYLGRYTHRVGISNGRILGLGEQGVTFATKNGGSCTLAPVEFLRRFLLHVLPKGFHKIRYYGLCSASHVARGTLSRVRDKLGAMTLAATTSSSKILDSLPASTPETWVECMLALTGIDVLRCPRCIHGRMLRVALEFDGAVAREDTS